MALPQDIAQVSTNWPAGNIGVALADYMGEPEQKWNVTAVTNAGGFPGSPYFKITIAGTDRALSAMRGGDLVVAPTFTGAPGQLWRLDQLADGTWRIMPDSVPGVKQPLALWAMNTSSVALASFNPAATVSAGCSKRPDVQSLEIEAAWQSRQNVVLILIDRRAELI